MHKLNITKRVTFADAKLINFVGETHRSKT